MKLSQRIDHGRPPRSAWLTVVPAVACLLLTWPAGAALEALDLEDPVPDTAVHPDRQQLETIIRGRYPQLMTQRFAGIPVVTVLLNHDGTLVATDLEISAKGPNELTVSRLRFARFGLKAADLSYIGVARYQLPLNTVLVMFGGKSTSDPLPASPTRASPAPDRPTQ